MKDLRIETQLFGDALVLQSDSSDGTPLAQVLIDDRHGCTLTVINEKEARDIVDWLTKHFNLSDHDPANKAT